MDMANIKKRQCYSGIKSISGIFKNVMALIFKAMIKHKTGNTK